ncbi:hypothetical protein GCM10010387_63870 [Streptomyces inusitatus]|uniref:Hydroxyisourate hydrolase n=1 Tax=Streptomyces inusitatus TaxID=68221 RepID=A0A918V2B2_9ACTN|nr:hypothetical protein GCM10010387_63870 [Streptomyces inusitatus]
MLHEVCACRAWSRGLLARRPFPGPDALLAASDAAVAELTARELAEALAGHPPIGRPEPGDPVSAREQRAMAGATAALRAEMHTLNQAYQERFGHVFLICATGLTAERLRDAIRLRVKNPPEREREIVRTELGRINRLRLTRLLDNPRPHTYADDAAERERMSTETTASVSTHVLDTGVGRPAAGVPVRLSARAGPGDDAPWTVLGDFATDTDGRCADLPPLPEGTAHARLEFRTGPHREGGGGAFFPEVAVVFAVVPGEHFHVPLLLGPFGYSVYRGS